MMDSNNFTADSESTILMDSNIEPISDWQETEKTTILDAMKELTSNTRSQSRQGRREMFVDMTDNAATRYLMRRLGISSRQVKILSCIMYHNQTTDRPCDGEDMAMAFGMHPFDTLGLIGDIMGLAEKGYLFPSSFGKDRIGCGSWNVSRQALEALSENRPLDSQSLRSKDTLAFLDSCWRVISDCSIDEGKNLELLFGWSMRFNDHLPIVQNLQRICGDDKVILKTLLYMAARQAVAGYPNTALRYLDNVMTELDARRTTYMFQNRTHPLVREGIVEPYCDNGVANVEEWCISRKGWTELVAPNNEEVEFLVSESGRTMGNLLEHDKITARPLFFYGETEKEVNRLRAMLQDDNYCMLVERLKANKMPVGLNILLYGSPGTGKTELVQQLARETGRDLMVVDMSQIRDKWVGESEQNLAQVFHSYRDCVSRSERTPILFCNECDAIFGSRIESVRGSVDKMENALQNILLEQMEKLEGIMICTTNLTSALDKAFERRFLLKLQLLKPNLQIRKQIWHEMMPSLTDEQRMLLAEKYSFSGGQIQNVVRKHIINGIVSGEEGVDFSSVLADCNAETMDRSNGRRVGF